MWMKYLIIGILSSAVCLLSSCGENGATVEYGGETCYVYENQLDMPVRIEYHWTEWTRTETVQMKPEHKSRTADVKSGESQIDIISTFSYRAVIIPLCDSVRLVFNNAKELWYFREKETDKQCNVFVLDNYTYTKGAHQNRSYHYKISQEIYNLATEIK